MENKPHDCLFCRIISGAVPSTIVYKDDTVVAIQDKFPQAKVHLLIIPRHHWATINDIPEQELVVLSHPIQVARSLAQTHQIAEPGFRLAYNVNREGGQTI